MVFLLGFCSSFPCLSMVMLIYIDLLFQRFGDRLDLPTYQGFPDSSVGKESTCNAGDPGLIPGFGRSTGEGIGYPLQYSWASLPVRTDAQWHRPQDAAGCSTHRPVQPESVGESASPRLAFPRRYWSSHMPINWSTYQLLS